MEFHMLSDGQQQVGKFISVGREVIEHIDYIHIREKHRPARELVDWIEQLVENGIPLSKIVVNDRVDVAYALGVAGVHLTEKSLCPHTVKYAFPNLRIGKSVHSVLGAMTAEREGADYVFFGHIFETPSKRNVAPKGINMLEEVCQHVSIPVIAIGGVKPQHVKQIQRTGAQGMAVLSPFWHEKDPETLAASYRKETVL
ncbi:thiamine phosphate synthase [Pontibacillus litoralis]|uniref:Thiamine phosphate synthase/TenI domain-containing protein n=1 Tax=Pontibacillus litoralis JSM 072002 TaxID=1385512 RepID=A0A0A5FW44_9BACI|nr:thiamine phosphate synthase [Pontibacillus litoralis]KGX84986.1 hypothetical protein N784_11465 [Pontibacillus litoralis JSM 072002]